MPAAGKKKEKKEISVSGCENRPCWQRRCPQLGKQKRKNREKNREKKAKKQSQYQDVRVGLVGSDDAAAEKKKKKKKTKQTLSAHCSESM